MGLNETFACVTSNICMQSPLSNVNHTCSLMIHVEKQREGYLSSYFSVDSSISIATQQKIHDLDFREVLIQNKRILSFVHVVRSHVTLFYKCCRIISFSLYFKFTKTMKSTRMAQKLCYDRK